MDVSLSYRLLHEDVRHRRDEALLEEPPTILVSGEGEDENWEFLVQGHVFEHRTGLEPEITLNIEPTLATRICMFSDAYQALFDIPAFFTAMANERPETLDGVQAILNGLGATDDTRRA